MEHLHRLAAANEGAHGSTVGSGAPDGIRDHAGGASDTVARANGPIGFGLALRRGLTRHCPYCDAPTLFEGYLKVRPICPNCGADNGRHRVDDVASYFTVLLVGHIVVAPALTIHGLWTIPIWAALSIMVPAVVAATLGALPFIKGGVIGALAATDQRKSG